MWPCQGKFDLLPRLTKFRRRVSHFGLFTIWALFNNYIEMFNVYKCMKYKDKLIRLSEFLSIIWILGTKGNYFGNSRSSPSRDRKILIQGARLCTDIWKHDVQGSFLKICKNICNTSDLLFTLCGYQIGNHDIIVLADVASSLLFQQSVLRKTYRLSSRSRSVKPLGACTGFYHSIIFNKN